MNRLDTLKAAAECVCGSREEDYGSPEDNFAVIAALWTDTPARTSRRRTWP
jgi:hypothetical protein